MYAIYCTYCTVAILYNKCMKHVLKPYIKQF